jgi:hypothetical protein
MKDSHRRAVTIMQGGILTAAALLVLYVYTYWQTPLPGFWSDLLTNLYGILAVGLSATAATAIWRRYKKSEKLFSIWRFFTLGLWTWLAADLVWAVYNMTIVEVPEVSFADLFYILGYCFFFIALHRQYKLLFHPTPRQDALITGGLTAAILLLSLLSTLLISAPAPGTTKFSLLINDFYPVGDLAIAAVALIFVLKFGRGIFARPWLGLVIFTITDSLYAWLYASGNYAYSVLQGNLASFVTDSLYTAAYLILAILLLNHYLLLRFGPSVMGNFAKVKKISPAGV